MLASLLPGLRDLRTPLAVGYLWLISVWLWFRLRLPARDEARGAIGDLYELAESVPPAAAFAAVTFVAYFVGSIVELDVARSAWLDIVRDRAAWQGVADRFRVRLEPTIGATREQATGIAEAWRRTAPARATRRVTLSPNVDREELRQRLAAEGRLNFDTMLRQDSSLGAHELPGAAGEVARKGRVVSASYSYEGQTEDQPWKGVRWAGPGSYGTAVEWTGRRVPVRADTLKELPPMAIAALYAVEAELPDLSTRILIERPAVFDKYDRLVAEASIRINMFPPLVALSATLALRAHWTWWFGTVVAALLLYQGLVRKSRANAVLLNAVATRLIESPTVEAIETAYRMDRHAADTAWPTDELPATADDAAQTTRPPWDEELRQGG